MAKTKTTGAPAIGIGEKDRAVIAAGLSKLLALPTTVSTPRPLRRP